MQDDDLGFDGDIGTPASMARAQTTVSTIPPGATSGGPDNRDRVADHWMLVVDGSGIALVDDQETELSPGALLLIGAGHAHEIRNTGDAPLKTINIYVPPAFDERNTASPR